MKGDKLIYFFNCYFLMLDYDEPLEKIAKYTGLSIEDIEKENDNNTKLLLNDLKYIFEENHNEEEYLNYILKNSDEMNVSKDELREIIRVLYSYLKKFS